MNSDESDESRSSDDYDNIFLEEEEEEESPINAIVYREMESLFETICEEKYELFFDQHTTFCNVIISGAENEDDILDNMTFNEDNLYEWFEEQKTSLLFGTDLFSCKPNLNKYVELIAKYDDYNKNYHRLVALKNSSKLNDDIVFNSIIGYL